MCGTVFSTSCRRPDLPTELLSVILLDSCEWSFSDFILFVRDRTVVLSVCKEWRDTVVGCIAFWTHIIVSQHLPTTTLALWLGRTATAALHIEICFENLAEFYGAEAVTPHICRYASKMLSVLLSRAEQWSSLAFYVESTTCLGQMLRDLRNHNTSALCQLDISSLSYISVARQWDGARLVVVPAQTFADSSSSLRELSLTTVSMDWLRVRSLSALEVLELSEFVIRHFPDWVEFRQMLSEATGLKKLVLRAIGCRMCPPAHGSQYIVLSNLKYLELEFRGHSSLADLFCTFSAPKLDILVVHFTRRLDLKLLAQCVSERPALLATVSQLTLIGYTSFGEASLTHIADIYRGSSMVRVLDLKHAVPLLFRRLLQLTEDDAKTKNRSPILPKLEELRVAGADALGLRSLIQGRESLAVTKLLRVYMEYPAGTGWVRIRWPDMEYVQSKVEVYNLTMCDEDGVTKLYSRPVYDNEADDLYKFDD
ncbi:hypothetical protein B0H11DRAFT_1912225 [Mycena galericulata]|nr:hypothetical protein B0H11DRAFT_1912225 [Mycena galericulata]